MSSFAFRDSVGLNCHFERTDLPPYTRALEVIDKFNRLGVKHLRTDVFNHHPDDAWFTDNHHRILKGLVGLGVKLTPMFGWQNGNPAAAKRYGPVPQIVDILKAEYQGAVVALEGPNEPDNPGVNPGSPSDWRTWTLNIMLTLKQASYRLNPRVPVLGPSPIGGLNPHTVLGPMSFMADGANVHPYTGNQHPTLQRIEEQRVGVAPSYPDSRPLYATEFGFTTSPTPGSGWPALDDRGQAVLLLRQLMTHFLAGIPRSFYYDFVDDGQEASHESRFGLLRYDLSEKTSYKALKKLLSVCDTTPPPSSPALNWTVSGAPNGARWFALPKADGSHLVLMWRESPLGTPAVPATLNFPGKTKKVSYDLVGGAADCPYDISGPFNVLLGDDPIAFMVR